MSGGGLFNAGGGMIGTLTAPRSEEADAIKARILAEARASGRTVQDLSKDDFARANDEARGLRFDRYAAARADPAGSHAPGEAHENEYGGDWRKTASTRMGEDDDGKASHQSSNKGRTGLRKKLMEKMGRRPREEEGSASPSSSSADGVIR